MNSIVPIIATSLTHLQKFANMEQSLFARFVRLGVPHIQLDAQGRARSEIAALYNWRYKKLGDLPYVRSMLEFRQCNPGFMHIYQMINVPEFNGIGECTPSPRYYQVNILIVYMLRETCTYFISSTRIWVKQNLPLLCSSTCACLDIQQKKLAS